MENKWGIVAAVVVLVVVLGGYMFFKNTPPQAPAENTDETTVTDATSTADVVATSTATTTQAQVKNFTVSGQNFSFSPATITVQKGDRVRITFVNSGGFHDFKIDAFSVATKQLQSGAQEVVEFTADKTGSFEYYCSVGNHRAMGMKGTLVVQ